MLNWLNKLALGGLLCSFKHVAVWAVNNNIE